MGSKNARWGILSVSAAVLLVSLRPEYSLLNSYALTAVAVFAVITLFRVVYATVLYPEYFTPLRHLPTPPVSWTQQRYLLSDTLKQSIF